MYIGLTKDLSFSSAGGLFLAFGAKSGGLHTWPVDLRDEGIQQCDWWRAKRSTFGPSH